jgi:hypothetical protein
MKVQDTKSREPNSGRSWTWSVRVDLPTVGCTRCCDNSKTMSKFRDRTPISSWGCAWVGQNRVRWSGRVYLDLKITPSGRNWVNGDARFERLVPTQMIHAKMTRSVIYRRNPVWLGVRKSLSTRSIPLLREEECGQIHGFTLGSTLCKVMGRGGGLSSVSGLWCHGVWGGTHQPM